ncbi:type II secretion system protein [Haloferula helveola]|uniref:type II secretion system protein n=1 Tax=Haloferula helveola TaxID=490095 RepID=UPI0030B445ED
MKSASPLRTRKPAGLTLLELTVVIAALLALVTVTMFGARGWRRASDRAACVINMRNVQASVRAYQNMYGYSDGTIPYADHGTQSIVDHLYSKGYIQEPLYEMVKGVRTCPGGGEYLIKHEEVFPPSNELYLTCSFEATQRHEMPADWNW